MKKGDIVTLVKEGKWTREDNLAIGNYYEIEAVSVNDRIRLKGYIYWQNPSNFKLKDMKLEITKEKVLAAASKCSTAKETLKTLFPEVFEDNLLSHIKDDGCWTDYRLCGDNEWIGKANFRVMSNDPTPHIFLTSDVNWRLEGNKLIPTKK